MNITIVEPKQKRNSFYQKAIEEYEKRLTRYVKLKKVHQLDKKWQNKEGCIVFWIQTGTDTVSSEELAEKIAEYTVSGNSHLVFFLEEVAQKEEQEIISLSFCSLPISKEMKSVLLREQLYRAYRILNHEPYHK